LTKHGIHNKDNYIFDLNKLVRSLKNKPKNNPNTHKHKNQEKEMKEEDTRKIEKIKMS
jgi:hypothetical protein